MSDISIEIFCVNVGGKWICLKSIQMNDQCLIVSMGSNGDFSFEQEMLQKTSCKVKS